MQHSQDVQPWGKKKKPLVVFLSLSFFFFFFSVNKQKTEHQSESNSATPWTLSPWKTSLSCATLKKSGTIPPHKAAPKLLV
jgi:hypothetical protein